MRCTIELGRGSKLKDPCYVEKKRSLPVQVKRKKSITVI